MRQLVGSSHAIPPDVTRLFNSSTAALLLSGLVAGCGQPDGDGTPNRPVALAGVLFAQQAAPAPVSIPVGNAEHGRYIVENVVHCVECHSSRDTQGNILTETRYLGGPLPFSPPWSDWATQVPRNKGLPGYTDQLAFRLFTRGSIGRRGEVLRPPMPRFRMTPQDAADVIAYMRSPS